MPPRPFTGAIRISAGRCRYRYHANGMTGQLLREFAFMRSYFLDELVNGEVMCTVIKNEHDGDGNSNGLIFRT